MSDEGQCQSCGWAVWNRRGSHGYCNWPIPKDVVARAVWASPLPPITKALTWSNECPTWKPREVGEDAPPPPDQDSMLPAVQASLERLADETGCKLIRQPDQDKENL